MKELTNAIDRLEEAIATAQKERALGPLERRLARLMRRMFREQKNYLLKQAKGGQIAASLDRVGFAALMADVERKAAELMTQAFERGRALADRDLAEAEDGYLDGVKLQMARRAAERIAGINDTTRGIIRELIELAQKEQWSYTKLAARIRAAFAEFARPAAQRHIRDRAELVAITEMGQAFVDGQIDATTKLILRGAQIEKAWLTVGDDRVSAGCRANDAAGWIPFAQAFPSGHAAPLRFPGCRCALQTRRKAP